MWLQTGINNSRIITLTSAFKKYHKFYFFFPILIGRYSQETFCMKKYKHGFNATILHCQVLVIGLILTQESHNNKSSFLCPFAFFWLQMRFPAA